MLIRNIFSLIDYKYSFSGEIKKTLIKIILVKLVNKLTSSIDCFKKKGSLDRMLSQFTKLKRP